jgi:hypothetical protein
MIFLQRCSFHNNFLLLFEYEMYLVVNMLKDNMMSKQLYDLDKNLSFESMLGELSAKLVNLPLESIDAGIESSLKLLVEFFEADRCHLGKISDDQSKIIVSYFKRYYEIVSKAAFSQAFLRLPGCVVHSAQANRAKEVSHV